jgi:hypothetical protein
MHSTHGITENDRHTHLHFGIIKLFDALVTATRDGKNESEWAGRFQSNVLSHRLEHFKQCASKFDRAAYLLDRCLRTATPHLEREYEIVQQLAKEESIENAAEPIVDHKLTSAKLTGYHGAAYDMPLYFDLMLFYLRIEADSYASLSSFLYPPIEERERRIDDKSFRSHRAWFQTHEDFDATYASILKNQSEWFELLSGEDPKGLRDVLVHHSGVTKFEWVKNVDSPWRIRGGLYRNDGPQEDDLVEALRTMTAGWFRFLDAVYDHFAARFVQAGFFSSENVRYIPTVFSHGGKLGVPSHKWVYPSIDTRK